MFSLSENVLAELSQRLIGATLSAPPTIRPRLMAEIGLHLAASKHSEAKAIMLLNALGQTQNPKALVKMLGATFVNPDRRSAEALSPALAEALTPVHALTVDDTAHLHISGPITPWSTPIESIRAKIGNARKVFLNLNSTGGNAGTAVKIYELLRERSTTVSIRDNALSAGAIVAMGGQHRRIASDAGMMIHVACVVAVGPAEHLLDYAIQSERLNGRSIELFTERTGQPRSVVEGWHSGDDYWFDAKAAVAAGLADEIFTPELPPQFIDGEWKAGTPAAPDDVDADAEALARELFVRLRNAFADPARFDSVLKEFAR